MKKNSTASNGDSKLTKTVLRELRQRAGKGRLTIGLDLGDRMTHYCVLDEKGELCIQGKLATTKTGLNPLLLLLVVNERAAGRLVSDSVGDVGEPLELGGLERTRFSIHGERRNTLRQTHAHEVAGEGLGQVFAVRWQQAEVN
ncbi:MAG: hypothetical protein ACKV22_29850 [Bryobacteraceae bacterium]